MELTGAEIIVRFLRDQGVRYVFGYPGGAVLHIYDALYGQQEVEHILVRHEQAATHAAESGNTEANVRTTDRSTGTDKSSRQPGQRSAVTPRSGVPHEGHRASRSDRYSVTFSYTTDGRLTTPFSGAPLVPTG